MLSWTLLFRISSWCFGVDVIHTPHGKSNSWQFHLGAKIIALLLCTLTVLLFWPKETQGIKWSVVPIM